MGRRAVFYRIDPLGKRSVANFEALKRWYANVQNDCFKDPEGGHDFGLHVKSVFRLNRGLTSTRYPHLRRDQYIYIYFGSDGMYPYDVFPRYGVSARMVTTQFTSQCVDYIRWDDLAQKSAHHELSGFAPLIDDRGDVVGAEYLDPSIDLVSVFDASMTLGRLVGCEFLAADKYDLRVEDMAIEEIMGSSDIGQNNEFGSTMLHNAAMNGHLRAAKLLLDRGIDAGVRNEHGVSALYFAAVNGYAAIAKLLIDAGAQVNIADNDGKTPLHCAARFGYCDIVSMLIQSGADASAKDTHGKTPLEYARKYDENEIATMLEAAVLSRSTEMIGGGQAPTTPPAI